jgi:HEAT repeat protein
MLGMLSPVWAAPPQDSDADGSEPAAVDPLAADRDALLDGTADELELSLHAKVLLEAGELETLRPLLVEDRPGVARAVLAALNSARHVGLVDEILPLAGAAVDEPLRRMSEDALRRMVCADVDVRAGLVADLRTGQRTQAERAAVVSILGACRDLSAVEPLLQQLGGPLASQAHDALSVLTGFDPNPHGDPEAWTRLWKRHQNKSREELLELALQRERAQNEADRAEWEARERAMVSEVEQARIDRMGSSDVSRLVAALTDEFARVRQTAVLRLAEHPSPELAASAVPALLERLSAPAPQGTNGEHEPLPQETNAAVRAALVTAAGELGRGLPEVLPVLIAELGSPHAEVSSAAVASLVKVRSRPAVVQPLLDLLDRSADDADTLALGLSIIAANRPEGVLPALERHLASAPTSAVQAEAVRALLACEELGEALGVVSGLADPAGAVDVRFALARGLGDRSREPAGEPDLRPRMVEMLAGLAADPDPSVRAEAVSSLGESGIPEALAPLELQAETETEPTVQLRIVRALGDLGSADGIDTIGRLAAGRTTSDPLWEEASAALSAMGAEISTGEWWAMAQTLQELRANELALVAVREIVSPSRPATVSDHLVPEARGLQAELLTATEHWQEAYDLLLVLAENEAPFPDTEQRLRLLGECAEQLTLFAEAADHHAARRDMLPEGDARRVQQTRRLAEVLWAGGLHERAVVEVQQLFDADREDNDLMCWLGEVRLALGEDDVARDLFNRLLERVPTDDEAMRGRINTALATLGPPTPEAEAETETEEGDEPVLEQAPPSEGGGAGA